MSSGVPIAMHFDMSMNWISTSSSSSFARPTSKITSLPSSCDDHVAGVQVGVDEAVLEAHLEHRHAHDLGELGRCAGVQSAGSASIFVPRTNSIVSTRSRDSSAWTSGNETSAWLAKFARNRV